MKPSILLAMFDFRFQYEHVLMQHARHVQINSLWSIVYCNYPKTKYIRQICILKSQSTVFQVFTTNQMGENFEYNNISEK